MFLKESKQKSSQSQGKIWQSRQRRRHLGQRTKTRKKTFNHYIIIKTLNPQNKEKTLKLAREKHQDTNKEGSIGIPSDLLTREILFQIMKNNCLFRLPCPTKLSIIIKG